MKKLINILLLLLSSIGFFYFYHYPSSVFSQEGGNYNCYRNAYGTCLIGENNCQPGYIPGECPQDCNSSPQPCVPDTLERNQYRCEKGVYGCIVGRERCDEQHFVGTRDDQGNIVTCPSCPGTYNCAEKESRICREDENCGPHCTCPTDKPVCTRIDMSNWRCMPAPPTPTGSIKPITLLKPKKCDKVWNPYEQKWEYRGIETALGCFPTQPKAIVQWILKYAIIIGGGIAFLLMLYGAFQIIISAGDPEKLKEGQQILGSAIGGLLFVIFAIFLLRLIGFTILRIPGWG